MDIVTAGIEFECRLRQMPLCTECCDRGSEAIGCPGIHREAPKESELALECGGRSGEAGLRQCRGDNAAMRRPASVQRLHGAAVSEEFEHARCLAQRDTDC